MIPSLTKARSVLKCEKVTGDRAVFEAHADKDEEPRFVFSMDRSVYADMGSPREVTVSVEPGDHLN